MFRCQEVAFQHSFPHIILHTLLILSFPLPNLMSPHIRLGLCRKGWGFVDNITQINVMFGSILTFFPQAAPIFVQIPHKKAPDASCTRGLRVHLITL